MIYANKVQDGTVNVRISQRGGGDLSAAQFIDELTAIYLALLEDSEDGKIVDQINEAITKAKENFLESRNNYFDSRKKEEKKKWR